MEINRFRWDCSEQRDSRFDVKSRHRRAPLRHPKCYGDPVHRIAVTSHYIKLISHVCLLHIYHFDYGRARRALCKQCLPARSHPKIENDDSRCDVDVCRGRRRRRRCC